MKKHYYCFILQLLLIPTFSFSQKPVKKDTKIIVIPTDTINLLNKISIALYEKGYSIESKDEQLKFIASTEKGFGDYSVKIRAFINDSVIVFTGQMASNISLSLWGAKTERAFENIYYGGMKGSQFRKAWDELDSFARIFGTHIMYSK
jgi:hypothetical protein